MSKNNQDIINIKNILTNVATSQKHLVTNPSTKNSSPTIKKDSKKVSLDKTNSVPVEDTDSINIVKGDSSIETKEEIEKINSQEEEIKEVEDRTVNKPDSGKIDTSKKISTKKQIKKIDPTKTNKDQPSFESQSASKANTIEKSNKARPRGSKKKEASNNFSIFIPLTDYEQVPSREHDFTSVRTMSKKSDALKILYPELSKVEIYDKLVTEHLLLKEKEFEEALTEGYKKRKGYYW